MNTATKLFTLVLFFVLSFGIFFTFNTTASASSVNTVNVDPDDYRREIVCIDGIWYEIVYAPDGGVIEVIIVTSN